MSDCIPRACYVLLISQWYLLHTCGNTCSETKGTCSHGTLSKQGGWALKRGHSEMNGQGSVLINAPPRLLKICPTQGLILSALKFKGTRNFKTSLKCSSLFCLFSFSTGMEVGQSHSHKNTVTEDRFTFLSCVETLSDVTYSDTVVICLHGTDEASTSLSG